jgi:hypothetical protein
VEAKRRANTTNAHDGPGSSPGSSLRLRLRIGFTEAHNAGSCCGMPRGKPQVQAKDRSGFSSASLRLRLGLKLSLRSALRPAQVSPSFGSALLRLRLGLRLRRMQADAAECSGSINPRVRLKDRSGFGSRLRLGRRPRHGWRHVTCGHLTHMCLVNFDDAQHQRWSMPELFKATCLRMVL